MHAHRCPLFFLQIVHSLQILSKVRRCQHISTYHLHRKCKKGNIVMSIADAAVKDALTNILNKPDHIIDNNGISQVWYEVSFLTVRKMILLRRVASVLLQTKIMTLIVMTMYPITMIQRQLLNYIIFYEGCRDVHCTKRYLDACKLYNNIIVEETIEITT